MVAQQLDSGSSGAAIEEAQLHARIQQPPAIGRVSPGANASEHQAYAGRRVRRLRERSMKRVAMAPERTRYISSNT